VSIVLFINSQIPLVNYLIPLVIGIIIIEVHFMTISERIKSFRKDKGLTQKELGDLINKSPQVISNWERGYTTTINHDDITNLSKVFNKSIEAIVGSDFRESNNDLPPLTPRDERQIAKDLEAMLNDIDNKNGMANYNEPEDEEDRELLRASLEQSLRLATRMAKKKFTPKKYQK
jgi:transcriptional regulator with XRE-family HTH domain